MAARFAIDKALRETVLAVSGVAALVSDRVFADEAAPQATPFPYVSLTLIGDIARMKSLGGPLKTCRARYQVDVYAATKEGASMIAELIAARKQDGGLDGFKGTMGSGAHEAFVQECWVVAPQHGSVDPASAQEARIYYAGFDLKLTFNG